jgi:hypothetical protein
MSRYVYTGSLVLITVLALGLVSATAAEERPFGARANGEFVILDGGLTVTIEEIGFATHLGRYQAEGVFTFAGVNSDGTFHFTTSVTYTAANGDTLSTTGIADVDLLTGITVGQDTFVGGTGRFADATGSISFVSIATGPTTYHSTITGIIDY